MLTRTEQRPPFAVDCPKCGGLGFTGMAYKGTTGPYGDDPTEDGVCSVCKGEGYVIDKTAHGKALAEAVAATTVVCNALGID